MMKRKLQGLQFRLTFNGKKNNTGVNLPYLQEAFGSKTEASLLHLYRLDPRQELCKRSRAKKQEQIIRCAIT